MAGFESAIIDIRASIADFVSGPEAQAALAAFAAEKRDEVIDRDKPSSVTTFVDGRQGAPLESVKTPDGVIRFEFGYLNGIVADVVGMLVTKSPVATKRPNARPPTHYRDEHAIFVNGAEVKELPTDLAPDATIVLVNLQPYSRKIERGFSAQAPSGVYQMVARMARQKWGRVASITFGYDIFPNAGPSRKNSVRGHAARARRDDRFPTITIHAGGE
jgi:hypothetical protein